jgi:hypothetical protein
MTLVKPKTYAREAWQYTVPGCYMPEWVSERVRLADDGALLLIRRSGDQEVRHGEYLLRDLDGAPEPLTPREYAGLEVVG